MLQDVPSIFTTIRTAKADAINAFHKLVYKSPGDRRNRQDLDTFPFLHFYILYFAIFYALIIKVSRMKL